MQANNNHNHGNAQWPPANRQLIELKRRNHEHVPLPLLFRAITQEAKYNKNFANAEWLFEQVMLDHEAREKSKGRYFSENDDRVFAKIIGTMVRYASTPQKSMHYATLFYKDFNQRIRTPSRELVVFTNLIFAHTDQPTPENMQTALEVYKIALQLGVYTHDPSIFIDPLDSNSFKNPIEVFTTVSKRLLKYYNLFLSADKTELVPPTHHFPR